jgi:hypothetical protein
VSLGAGDSSFFFLADPKDDQFHLFLLLAGAGSAFILDFLDLSLAD